MPARTTVVFVRYNTVPEQTTLLIIDVQALLGDGVLNPEHANVLIAKLERG